MLPKPFLREIPGFPLGLLNLGLGIPGFLELGPWPSSLRKGAALRGRFLPSKRKRASSSKYEQAEQSAKP